MLALGDLPSLQGLNPSVDFSQPPREGDVLRNVSDPPATTTTSTYPQPTVPCDSTSTPPAVLVINASHVNGTAGWWKDLLASNVSNVSFADPMNALVPEASSRVLALDGHQCEASQIAALTTGGYEPATIDSMQSLVGEPLPEGTSIVVVIGDDNLSQATLGATSTTIPETTTTSLDPVGP
jgi:hypothetical protein